MLINTFFTVVALVIIFLFSIKKFSGQIEKVAGDKFKYIVRNLTSTPFRGTVVGTLVASLMHSSAAVTVMTVSFVDAGIISFFNSLGVIIGANIGTTLTSQLIALKLTYIAPYIVVLGFILNIIDSRFKRYGKPIFYFGLVFMSLSLMSTLVIPLQQDPQIIRITSLISNFSVALFAGVLVTVLFQSSTVVTGIVLILVGSNFLNFEQALGMILGSNIGTTSTALVASLTMGYTARKTAIAHFLYNVIGVILVLPFIDEFTTFVQFIGGDLQRQVANTHLFFNLASALLFLLFVKPFAQLVDMVARERERKKPKCLFIAALV